MERYILANLDRVFSRESSITHLEFYFDPDYTIEEMEHEVQEELRNVGSLVDWTTVPEVRHKLKVTKVKLF